MPIWNEIYMYAKTNNKNLEGCYYGKKRFKCSIGVGI